MLSTEPCKTCTPKSCSALLELSFERFSQRIAFRELSNSPPLTRSCQEGSDAISLDSAFYAGPAIAFCDGSRIHGDADRGDLDCAEKNEMSSHLLYGALSSRCWKARNHNRGSEGRHGTGVQALQSVRARQGLIQILEAIPAARRCRGDRLEYLDKSLAREHGA